MTFSPFLIEKTELDSGLMEFDSEKMDSEKKKLSSEFILSESKKRITFVGLSGKDFCCRI